MSHLRYLCSSIHVCCISGPIPSADAHTKAKFSLSRFICRSSWSATAETSDSIVSLTVCLQSNAHIGVDKLILDQGEGVSLAEFVLLFNPWCKKDSVYLAGEAEREEYVISQDGLVYRGIPKRITVLPWIFGQFEPGILDICLQILDESPNYMSDAALDCSERRNPVYVTRVLSAMVNSLGDKGVLAGNWSGDYEDGVKPTVWKDSCSNLHFSGIMIEKEYQNMGTLLMGDLCPMSRALGIPCRVGTNFGSARDSNGDLIMERFYNEFDENIADDSIWNFHVWVENRMTRPDLTLGYEGWQASDPTPQHRSDGVFCCGPAPVRAIKEGELTFKYDIPFVYAKVNADVVEYIKLRDGRVFKMGGSTTEVGKSISTKAVGRDEREDITHNCKYPETGATTSVSHLPQDLLPFALHLSTCLHIKVRVTPDMQIGSDFDVYAELKNNTMVTKSWRVMFYAQAVSYNGTLGETCGLGEFTEMNLASSEGEPGSLHFEFTYAEYSKAITQDRMIKPVALLIDTEKQDFYRAKKTILLDAPEIIINILGVPKVGQNLVADLVLQNPLPEPLELRLGRVGPKEFATAKVEFTPKLPGQRKILIDFASNKLHNIETFENLVIYE
ncbi:protein-glutamine gamma-glutamyltransferase 2-like [Sinocyclocheilus grahami]|uniref:protein-glutamine gamma-glutamyltransferase 2-like n=1 Tax=Sinocyclocheilus grahami TaxID=75366 RepID=UPI0007ACA619|nr:PREDICTED: protein-glutamine gamma-glutamyltransferase 2-like [Sinocyclocheilus grahami]